MRYDVRRHTEGHRHPLSNVEWQSSDPRSTGDGYKSHWAFSLASGLCVGTTCKGHVAITRFEKVVEQRSDRSVVEAGFVLHARLLGKDR